ncbi:MAG: iron ABC transporter permease [Micropruina sp.]|nr:iron ABC transporter permease [Micropruina sp.]
MAAVRRPELLLGALLAAAVSLIPGVYLIIRAGEAGWDRILAEVFTARVGAMTWRSIALMVVVWLFSTLLGVSAALLVTRTNVPGRRAFGILLALPLAVPSYVAAYTWVAVADLWNPTGRFDGFWAAAIVLSLYSYPYVYLPVVGTLAGQDAAPAEIARALGHREFSVLWRVVLPAAMPAITSGGLLVALYTLSDFGAVSILRVDTFTRAVFTAFSVGFDRTGAIALAALLMVFALLVVTAESLARGAERRQAKVGGAGRRRVVPQDLGRGRWIAFAVLGGLVITALGVPLAALVRWNLAGVSRPGGFGEVISAIGGSLGASLLGAGLTILLAIPLGLYAARVPSRLSRALERLVFVTHSLPGVMIGLSLVFFGINVVHALYQSIWLLGLAYVTLFLPLAVAAVTSAAAKAPLALEEVAQSLGSTPLEALRRVTLPVMLPGIGAGGGAGVADRDEGAPATLLLRPAGMERLATRLWTYTAVEAYAAAAPYAAILVALAAVPTWLLASGSGAFGREPQQ